MADRDLLQQISAMIKGGRTRKEWNQTQLATHAGVSYTVVQGIEQGLRAPNVRTVMLLLKALNLQPTLTAHNLDTAMPLLLVPEEAAPEPAADESLEIVEDPVQPPSIEVERMLVEAFRKRFPDPEHVAARTFLEEHPDVVLALDAVG